MNKTAIDSAVLALEQLDYTEKLCVFNRVFSIGNLSSSDLNDRLILISLVSLAYQKMKEKDPTITPLHILMKITGQRKDDSAFYQFLESLSIIVEDFSYNCVKIDTCGMKNSDEVFNRINEILNTWLPF